MGVAVGDYDNDAILPVRHRLSFQRVVSQHGMGRFTEVRTKLE